MSSIFSEKSIEKMKSIKKVFLWIAVCILIGEVVVGAIIIMSKSYDLMIGKIMGTFGLCAIAMFIGVNNFTRMEKGNGVVQGFAATSLVMNMVWLVLAIVMIWGNMDYYEYAGGYYNYSLQLTIMAKMLLMSADVAFATFLISNVWSIKETVKPVRPLKITALVCELYCVIYAVVVIFGGAGMAMDMRWSALSGLAGFAFIVMAIAAVLVSRSGAKKNAEAEASLNKEEVQATIQEMVEKEVQERLKAEKEKAERDAMPPLQAADMPPTVNRDGEVKVGDLQKPVVSETPQMPATPEVPQAPTQPGVAQESVDHSGETPQAPIV